MTLTIFKGGIWRPITTHILILYQQQLLNISGGSLHHHYHHQQSSAAEQVYDVRPLLSPSLSVLSCPFECHIAIIIFQIV